MITRDAIYTFIEDLITAAGVGTPLYEAVSARNLRTSVDSATKVIRVECFAGEFVRTAETKRSELNVKSLIQTFVTPAGTEESDLDDATDLSFDMAKVIHDAIADHPDLDGTVCDAQFREFETGYANLGTMRRGTTYLDGTINQVS